MGSAAVGPRPEAVERLPFAVCQTLSAVHEFVEAVYGAAGHAQASVDRDQDDHSLGQAGAKLQDPSVPGGDVRDQGGIKLRGAVQSGAVGIQLVGFPVALDDIAVIPDEIIFLVAQRLVLKFFFRDRKELNRSRPSSVSWEREAKRAYTSGSGST